MSEVSKIAHEWSQESLFSKSQSYVEVMLTKNHSDWQFAFWSSLVLELLLRATLSSVSMVLLADSKSSHNILYAVEQKIKQKKFTPKSIEISEVLNRLENIFENITPELKNFCLIHLNRRNSELHSGNLPFYNLDTSTWLPKFYWVCKELCICMDIALSELLGKETAQEAEELIGELRDENAQSIQQLIKAHKTIWESKSTEEKQELTSQADVLMNRHVGHRVNCPACNNTAIVKGTAIGEPIKEIVDDGIIEKQTMKPSNFECIACKLKITGYSKLMHGQLADSFIEKSFYDASEYFDIDIDIEEDYRGYMDDNNDFY